MLCVHNHDEILRECIDCQLVSLDIVNDAFLIHQIDEKLEAMMGFSVFTTLELTKGYHLLIITLNWNQLPSSSAQRDSYKVRSSQSVETTGAVLQRVIDHIISYIQPQRVSVYIDDIKVYSPTMEFHL